MAFALREKLASDSRGKDIWFRFWTQIGPCATDDEKERALFPTQQDAYQSSAYLHPLSFYEPVEVAADAPGDLNWNRPADPEPRRRKRR